VLVALPVAAAPLLDAGEFPTLTPTWTLIPSATASPTQDFIIVTLDSGYPPPTNVVESLDPGDASNIQQEDLQATRLAEQQAAAEESSGGNPLITAAYIGLFILLVVGVWMLFSRRGIGP
jgi:hypothetical protein